MSLADYLAKNYLSEDKKTKKKKKEKSNRDNTKEKVSIVGDDINGWDSSKDTTVAPTPVGTDDGMEEPIKTTVGGWKRIGDLSVEREITLAKGEPKVEVKDEVFLPSGIRAGLQSAAQVQEDIERKKRREQKEMELLEAAPSDTVYRDATGRIIDVRTKRSETKREEMEKSLRETRIKEMNQGVVQREQARLAKERLDQMRGSSLHVTEDDDILNEDLRSIERFNDPVAKFLKKSTSRSLPPRRVYQGTYGSNRFNISPGPQWDGVDRSNGFEDRWFQKQNERKEKATLTYQMALDD
jgi:pre-mRNA-splicing factor CWC26